MKVDDPEGIAPPGRYAVVLARVEGHGERAVRELWVSAVDLGGREAPIEITHALLAALARGELHAADEPADASRLVAPIARATELLEERTYLSRNGDAPTPTRWPTGAE